MTKKQSKILVQASPLKSKQSDNFCNATRQVQSSEYNPRSVYDSLNLKPVQELRTVPDCNVRMTKPRFILLCARP